MSSQFGGWVESRFRTDYSGESPRIVLEYGDESYSFDTKEEAQLFLIKMRRDALAKQNRHPLPQSTTF